MDFFPNIDRVGEKSAYTNGRPRSDGIPILSGDIPRVDLPTGKPLSHFPCASAISQHPRQPPNLGYDQHYPIPNKDHLQGHQQQELPSFHSQQPALQLPLHPRVASVSSRRILLLEREVQLQEDLAIVIGQKSLMNDTDSRECYIAVLKQEIAIRKQLEQVSGQ